MFSRIRILISLIWLHFLSDSYYKSKLSEKRIIGKDSIFSNMINRVTRNLTEPSRKMIGGDSRNSSIYFSNLANLGYKYSTQGESPYKSDYPTNIFLLIFIFFEIISMKRLHISPSTLGIF